MAIGRKSFSVSNGSGDVRGYSGYEQRVAVGRRARDARPVMSVLLPETFSTTKFWPSFAAIFGATCRATWSVGPPAG